MNDRIAAAATALTVLVLCLAGFIDALRDDDTGSAVLFASIFVGVLFLARTRTKPSSIQLRRDLASWLDRTSPTTGETPDQLGDRAVSRLRAGFSQLPRDGQ